MTFTQKLAERREKLKLLQDQREAEQAAERAARREASMQKLCNSTTRSLHRGSYEGGTSGEAVEKPVEHRNPRLLAMARGKPCLLRIPGVCNNDPETTVACHSNQSKHGKGGALKASDAYAVWGCAACHEWLDRGPAPYETKVMAFDLAHAEQVEQWKAIATDRQNRNCVEKHAADWALMLVDVPGGELA